MASSIYFRRDRVCWLDTKVCFKLEHERGHKGNGIRIVYDVKLSRL